MFFAKNQNKEKEIEVILEIGSSGKVICLEMKNLGSDKPQKTWLCQLRLSDQRSLQLAISFELMAEVVPKSSLNEELLELKESFKMLDAHLPGRESNLFYSLKIKVSGPLDVNKLVSILTDFLNTFSANRPACLVS